jgi:hypothetical protein
MKTEASCEDALNRDSLLTLTVDDQGAGEQSRHVLGSFCAPQRGIGLADRACSQRG